MVGFGVFGGVWGVWGVWGVLGFGESGASGQENKNQTLRRSGPSARHPDTEKLRHSGTPAPGTLGHSGPPQDPQTLPNALLTRGQTNAQTLRVTLKSSEPRPSGGKRKGAVTPLCARLFFPQSIQSMCVVVVDAGTCDNITTIPGVFPICGCSLFQGAGLETLSPKPIEFRPVLWGGSDV